MTNFNSEVIVLKERRRDALPDRNTPPKKRHVGTNAFIGTFGTSVFIQGCTLLQGIILARLLGPTGRGELAAVILWPTIFAGVGLLGVNNALARRAAKEDDLGSVMRTALVLSFILSVLTAFVCFLVLGLLIPSNQKHILPLATAFLMFIPLNHLGLNLVAVDQGAGRFSRLNFTRALLNPVNVVSLAVIWVLGLRDLMWFLTALLFGNAVVVVTRTITMLRDHGLRGAMQPPIEVLREGLPFGFATLCSLGYQHIDKVLLMWLLGPRNLGLYVVALSASGVLSSITSSMGIVSFAMTAQAPQGEGFGKVASAFRKALLIWLLFGGLLALAMPFLLPLVYGVKFSDAVAPAILLIGGSALSGLASLLDQCMRGQGKPFAGVAGRIGAIITMVVVGYSTSQSWGVRGISLAFVVSQFVCFCLIFTRLILHYDRSRLLDFVPKQADIVAVSTAMKRCCKNFTTKVFSHEFHLPL